MACFRLFLVALVTAVPALGQPLFVDATDRLPAWDFPSNSMDVEAADLDADGTLDLAVANEFHPNVLLLNDGTGTFTNAAALLPEPPGTLPPNFPSRDTEDIVIADLDGNGTLDLVFVSEDDVNAGGSGVHEVYLRNADGTYTAVPDALPDSEANAVVHADLTGDGRPDLLLGNAGQDLLLINDGTGAFTDETADRLPIENRTSQDVEFADVDGDGALDIVVGNEDGNRVLINDGTGVFTDETEARFPATPPIETRKVTPADVDGDGDLDLFFANVGWSGLDPQDRLFLNDGDGVFTDATAERLPASTLTSLDGKLADLDTDGDLDLVVVGVRVSGGLEPAPIEVYRNTGGGFFERADALLALAPVLVAGLGIEVADFDGNGFPDLYVADRGNPDRLFLHIGAATDLGEAVPAGQPSLAPVVPNPARGVAHVRFHLPSSEPATLAVFDVLGRRIAALATGQHPAGEHVAQWDGSRSPAGLYVVRLATPGGTRTRSFTLLR